MLPTQYNILKSQPNMYPVILYLTLNNTRSSKAHWI